MSTTAAAKPVTGMQKVFGFLSKSISGMLGPLGYLIQIFEALGVIQPLLDTLNAFVAILGTAFMPLMSMLLEILTPLIPPFQELITALTPLITLVGQLLIPFFSMQVILDLVTIAMNALTAGLNFLNPYIQKFADWVAAIDLTQILGWLTTLWEDLQALGNAFKEIWNSIDETFTNVSDWFNNLGQNILDALLEGYNKITEFFRNIWTDITDALASGWEDAKDAIVEVFSF